MGSNESHFNVSVGSDGQSRKAVSTNHDLFEEKGEPKRYRTEVLPLTNRTALPLGQTGSPKLVMDHFALRPQKRGGLLGTGTGGKGTKE